MAKDTQVLRNFGVHGRSLYNRTQERKQNTMIKQDNESWITQRGYVAIISGRITSCWTNCLFWIVGYDRHNIAEKITIIDSQDRYWRQFVNVLYRQYQIHLWWKKVWMTLGNCIDEIQAWSRCLETLTLAVGIRGRPHASGGRSIVVN